MMARKTVVTLVDDLDGSEADQTVTFSLNGTSYEIDVNQTHADDLATKLEPFIQAGRKVGKGRASQANSSTTNATAIRTWARENGFEVSDRGRVPKDVARAYEQRN